MKKHFLIFTISLLFFTLAQGKVKLPAMMGDHMVLQQNSSVKLWGWADGKKVTVTTSWNNRTYKVSTDDEGAWLVKVDTPAGSFTPYSITISDGTRVTLSDILIGEVWICSGQSNMEMTMKGNMGQPIDHSLETLLNAGNYRDRIRFITVPRTKGVKERTDFEGAKWEVSSPETTMDCSAAGYFFARQLTETLHLPVGLVINSWGGSRIEAWMTEEALASVEGADIEAAKNPKLDTNSRLQCLYNIMLLPVKYGTRISMVSGRVESIQLSDLCSDDDCDGAALEKCMGSTGYAFLLCPDCSAQIRKQPEYKFRLIAGSTNESIADNPQLRNDSYDRCRRRVLHSSSSEKRSRTPASQSRTD